MKNILFLISIVFLFSCEEIEDFFTPFYLAENGVTVKAKDWVTAGTTGELNGIFYTAVNIDTLRLMFSREEDVSKVVTTLITDMSNLFSNVPIKDVGPYRPHELQFNPNISSWDVSNVTNMQKMFGTDSSSIGPVYVRNLFNQDISSWDVSNVVDMSYMFNNCHFNQPINSWNTSNVRDMSYMFHSAGYFDQQLGSWDVSNVTNMQGMFGFTRAFNRDISNWCVSKITSRPHGFHSSFTFEIPEAYLPVWGTCPG